MCVIPTTTIPEPELTQSELIQIWTRQMQEKELVDKIVARVIEELSLRREYR